MTFPNAFDGVKKIYLAEILTLIGTGLSLITSVLGIAGESSDSLMLAALVFLLIGVGLSLAAEILNIVGVNRASKDEAAFRKALYAIFAGIVANVLISAASENQVLVHLGDFIETVSEFLASYFICTGIINLADKLEDAAVSAKGKKVRTLLMGIFATSAVLSLLSAIFYTSETLMNLAGVVALISSVFAIVAYFMYLGLLKKAKVMLAA